MYMKSHRIRYKTRRPAFRCLCSLIRQEDYEFRHDLLKGGVAIRRFLFVEACVIAILQLFDRNGIIACCARIFCLNLNFYQLHSLLILYYNDIETVFATTYPEYVVTRNIGS